MKTSLDDVGYFLVDEAAIKGCFTARTKSNGAGGESEEGMVAADFHIFPCLNLRAALADDNHAGAGGGAIGKLYPEVFRV